MLKALIVICTLATPTSDCTTTNARHVVQVPGTFGMPHECLHTGEEFLAALTVGQEMAADEHARVICRRVP